MLSRTIFYNYLFVQKYVYSIPPKSNYTKFYNQFMGVLGLWLGRRHTVPPSFFLISSIILVESRVDDRHMGQAKGEIARACVPKVLPFVSSPPMFGLVSLRAARAPLVERWGAELSSSDVSEKGEISFALKPQCLTR